MKRDLGTLVAREHDLVIVGGGIAGAAAAADAAQRGLTVALLEAADFGSGTSWNSLKTIHGGLRHLQRLDLRGLRESARERSVLLRIAPELVRPLSFLVPTYGHGARGPEAFWLGTRLNDLLTASRNRDLPPDRRIARARVLSTSEVRARLPGLDGEGLSGGVSWTDAQVSSSERLLLGFLHAAAASGASLANYVEVTELRLEGSRVTGVRATDGLLGTSLEVRARSALNATNGGLFGLLGRAGIAGPRVPFLHGMNLVLRRPPPVAEAVGATAGGRHLFLVPWGECVLVGTEYAQADGPRPEAEAFLSEAERAFPWAGLKSEQIALVHRGQVPGEGGALGLWTRDRVLDHQREDAVGGLVSIVSSKYTTARRLAERAVDVMARRQPRPLAASRTSVTPLIHARPLLGSLQERTRWAVRQEMAWHLSDAVLRRLDLGTRGCPAADDLEVVARTMAEEHGWSEARQAEERDELGRFYDERR